MNPKKENPKKEMELGSYLTGLFEGDGHISISKPDAKVKNLSLSITFNLKDLPLAKRLKEVLGHGWIRIKEKENACVLTFHTIDGLIYIVSLMNSYLRTPKLIKFNELIDILNKKRDLNIKKFPIQTQDLNKDAWLAGFVEADGSFGIVYIDKEVDESGKTTKKRRVSCRLRIEQRMIDPYTNESYEPILKSIANFLGVNLVIVTRNTGKQYFNVSAKSRKSLNIIKDYFNTYPLFSSKYLDYKDFEEVVNFILQQTHYEDENSTRIKELKNGMNNNRTRFHWDHLGWLGKTKKSKNLKSHSSLLKYSTNKNINNNTNNNNTNNNKHKDQILGYYLAGLIEGDGNINLTNKDQAVISITFNSKDRPLAEKLLSYIGQGFIQKRKGNSVVLIFGAVKTIKRIVALINGKFRTPALWRRVSHKAGDKLSNSGDSLKLMGPSNNRKVICGGSNQLCMVIAHKIIEREIGYRGSKSGLYPRPVKEQRVDGSWQVGGASCLRCTLMGFEINYQIKAPSKQLRFYSILGPAANNTQVNY